MHTISVWFGQSPMPWTLVYNDHEKADTQYRNFLNPDVPATTVEFSDDYGQKLFLDRTNVLGVLLEDIKQSALAKIEMGLHNARTQAQAQSRAQGDQVLRLNGAGGPPMLSPMFRGN